MPSGSMHDNAIDRAKVRGHAVEYDGPTVGGADRWTCTRCGRAVLWASGPMYGSALIYECMTLDETRAKALQIADEAEARGDAAQAAFFRELAGRDSLHIPADEM